MTPVHWPACVLLLVVVAACIPGCSPRRYSGYYYMNGFEVSLFRPVNSHERWWLAGTGTIICPLPANSYIYLEVVGELSFKGRYGHNGLYDRQLRTVEVVSCRPAREDELRQL